MITADHLALLRGSALKVYFQHFLSPSSQLKNK